MIWLDFGFWLSFRIFIGFVSIWLAFGLILVWISAGFRLDLASGLISACFLFGLIWLRLGFRTFALLSYDYFIHFEPLVGSQSSLGRS